MGANRKRGPGVSPNGRGRSLRNGNAGLAILSPFQIALREYDNALVDRMIDGPKPTTTTEECTMTETMTPLDDHPVIKALRQEVTRLRDDLYHAHDAYNRLTLRVDDLDETVGRALHSLIERVTDLEQRPTGSIDPNEERVLAFYQRIAPVKMSYTDVADELGLDKPFTEKIVLRLQRAGRLQVHETRNEGSSKTFRKWSYVDADAL